MIIARTGVAVRGDPLQGRPVIVKVERSASRLLIVEQLERGSPGLHIDTFMCAGRRHADSAESVDAVAGTAHQPVSMPAARRSAAYIQAPVPHPRTSRKGVSPPTVTEAFLK